MGSFLWSAGKGESGNFKAIRMVITENKPICSTSGRVGEGLRVNIQFSQRSNGKIRCIFGVKNGLFNIINIVGVAFAPCIHTDFHNVITHCAVMSGSNAPMCLQMCN